MDITGSESKEECSICFEQGVDCKLIPCGHVFHWECVSKYFFSKEDETTPCPMCREESYGWYDKFVNKWVNTWEL